MMNSGTGAFPAPTTQPFSFAPPSSLGMASSGATNSQGAPINFSSTPVATTGFGITKPATTVGGINFNFGLTTATASPIAPTASVTGFLQGFGNTVTTPASVTGFQGFGNTVTTPASGTGFQGLGNMVTTPASGTGFQGLGNMATTPASGTGFQGLGNMVTTPASGTGFQGLGNMATTPATVTGFQGFGNTVTTPASVTGFQGFGNTVTTPASVTGFQGFGNTVTTPASVIGFQGLGSTVTAPASVTGFQGLGNTVTTSASVTGFQGLGNTVTAPASNAAPSGFQAPTSTVQGTSSAPVTLMGAVTPSTSATLTSAPSAAAVPTSATTGSANLTQLNFRQLQEMINKWTIELGEQEKSFIELATKVNAWDKTVMSNGEKIATLDDAVSKVKGEHVRLEHTLEYLKSQQEEFEAFLVPLEASLPANICAEPEREHLYTVTENMDTSLQQMAEDIKEIIRHINDSNKTMDKADPVAQILKILNDHTDALQWVEENANGVKKSLEDVSKMHQVFRKDHEKSLRMMFHH